MMIEINAAYSKRKAALEFLDSDQATVAYTGSQMPLNTVFRINDENWHVTSIKGSDYNKGVFIAKLERIGDLNGSI